MFNKSKEREMHARLQKYEAEKKLEIDKTLFEYKKSFEDKIINLARMCAQQTAEYEHTFHSSKEAKGIELAKLDAQLEYKKEQLEINQKLLDVEKEALQKVIDEKERTIQTLTSLLTASLEKVSCQNIINPISKP
jgi:transketolase